MKGTTMNTIDHNGLAANGTEIEVVTESGGVELQGFSTFEELAELSAEFLEFF